MPKYRKIYCTHFLKYNTENFREKNNRKYKIVDCENVSRAWSFLWKTIESIYECNPILTYLLPFVGYLKCRGTAAAASSWESGIVAGRGCGGRGSSSGNRRNAEVVSLSSVRIVVERRPPRLTRGRRPREAGMIAISVRPRCKDVLVSRAPFPGSRLQPRHCRRGLSRMLLLSPSFPRSRRPPVFKACHEKKDMFT